MEFKEVEFEEPVTVIIPVYNAYTDVQRCIESVLSKTKMPYWVLIIDDASTDFRIKPLLDYYQREYTHLRVLHLPKNDGYTSVINRGVTLTSSDVVLLNSDTIVSEGWLSEIRETAYRAEKIATVTPLSNAAGAYSIPKKNYSNPIPPGQTIDSFAKLVEELSERIYPDVPTGNGYCMYIRREALDEVGYFDEESFPGGYGEENDFCMRARELGYSNKIDDATFIYHKRTASFKDSKQGLIEAHSKVLSEKHPDYKRLVADWLENDPMDSFRSKLQEYLNEKVDKGPDDKPSKLLYIIHDGAGGTLHTTRDLIKKVQETTDCLLLKCGLNKWNLLKFSENGSTLVKEYIFGKEWRIFSELDRSRIAALQEIIDNHGIKIVHIRHLISSAPEIIPIIKNRTGIQVVLSFHDFYGVCPTIQLLDENLKYCAGHCTETQGDCPVSLTWFKELPRLKHNYVFEWRERVRRNLIHCDACVTTSVSPYEVIVDHFPELKRQDFRIIEHGRNLEDYGRKTYAVPRDEINRVVYFGVLGKAKGIRLVTELLELNETRGHPFEFHILGTKDLAFQPESYGGIYHGEYKRDDLPELLEEIRPSIAILPSVAPETYSHALTEAWAAGIPVIASNMGALQDRVMQEGGGWLVDPAEPLEWFNLLMRLKTDQNEYMSKALEAQNADLRSIEDMAEEYLELYYELGIID